MKNCGIFSVSPEHESIPVYDVVAFALRQVLQLQGVLDDERHGQVEEVVPEIVLKILDPHKRAMENPGKLLHGQENHTRRVESQGDEWSTHSDISKGDYMNSC